jgi:hypothetical protein
MDTHVRVPYLVATLSLLFVFLLLMIMAAPSIASPLAPLLAPDTVTDAGVAPDAGLTALDVPESALPVLDRLGVAYQQPAHNGLLRGAADARQLGELDKAGIAYRTVGKVAIFEGDDQPDGPGLANPSCIAENFNSMAIPVDRYVYSNNFTGCYPNGTVNWVDLHFIISNAFYGPYSNGRLAEIYVNLGRNSPDWRYTNVGESWYSCAVSSPPLDGQDQLATLGTYDRWLFNVDATMGTNIFTDIPANQRWNLAAYHPCPNSPTAYISYWGIWAYYTPFPTPTPSSTATPTRTFTRTPTGAPPITATPTRTVTRTPTGAPPLTATRTPTSHGPWPRRIWLPLILQS